MTTTHAFTITRFQRGKQIPSGRTAYGTKIRCSCGEFSSRVNAAPTAGGRIAAKRRWDEHVKEARG